MVTCGQGHVKTPSVRTGFFFSDLEVETKSFFKKYPHACEQGLAPFIKIPLWLKRLSEAVRGGRRRADLSAYMQRKCSKYSVGRLIQFNGAFPVKEAVSVNKQGDSRGKTQQDLLSLAVFSLRRLSALQKISLKKKKNISAVFCQLLHPHRLIL